MTEIHDLDQVIARSEEFVGDLIRLLEPLPISDDDKSIAILAMFNITLEHATSLRELIRIGLPTSAMAMLRLQYEAVVRAIWILYAASDNTIAKLVAPLTPESAQAASNGLPAFSIMLKEIEKNGPSAVHRLLSEFKDYSWRPLNSFVHSGIHAVSMHTDGFPATFLAQAIRQSNNLFHMSAIALASHLENAALTASVVAMYSKYADCLQLKSPG